MIRTSIKEKRSRSSVWCNTECPDSEMQNADLCGCREPVSLFEIGSLADRNLCDAAVFQEERADTRILHGEDILETCIYKLLTERNIIASVTAE